MCVCVCVTVQEWSQEDGRLLWSGLRIRIGMAHGFIGSKKPLNTGRTYGITLMSTRTSYKMH